MLPTTSAATVDAIKAIDEADRRLRISIEY